MSWMLVKSSNYSLLGLPNVCVLIGVSMTTWAAKENSLASELDP